MASLCLTVATFPQDTVRRAVGGSENLKGQVVIQVPSIGEQQWVTGFECVQCCRMVDSVPMMTNVTYYLYP